MLPDLGIMVGETLRFLMLRFAYTNIPSEVIFSSEDAAWHGEE